MTILSLKSATRQRSRCSYWDYYADERRISTELGLGDFIPPIGWLGSEMELHFLEMLLRVSEGDLPQNRVPIFVCGECADYGCGVVSCVVERANDEIVWHDFGIQNDDSDRISREDFRPWQKYSFEPSQYWSTFAGHYELAKHGE